MVSIKNVGFGKINLNTNSTQNKYTDLSSISMMSEKGDSTEAIKPKIAPKVCPIDPAERAQCDSCQ